MVHPPMPKILDTHGLQWDGKKLHYYINNIKQSDAVTAKYCKRELKTHFSWKKFFKDAYADLKVLSTDWRTLGTATVAVFAFIMSRPSATFKFFPMLAVAYGVSGTTYGTTVASTFTITIDIGTSPTAIFAQTGCVLNFIDNITDVKWNGSAMTLLGSNGNFSGNGGTAGTFWKASPSTGSHDLVATYTGAGNSSGKVGLACATVTGSDTANPIDVSGSTSSSGTTASQAVTTTKANDMLLEFISSTQGGSSSGPVYTENNSQTNVQQVANTGIGQSVSWKAAASVTTYTETYTNGNNNWFYSVIAIQPPTTVNLSDSITVSESVNLDYKLQADLGLYMRKGVKIIG